MKDTQTLKFHWLKYEISDIEELINNSPGIDSFVFSYYFPHTSNPGKPIELISYAHMYSDNSNEAHYSSYYDKLEVFNNNALEAGGPLILSNNIITLAAMQSLINNTDPHGDRADFLVFAPSINESGHIYYDILSYKRQGNGEVQLPGDPLDTITNPSPPATLDPE